MKGLSKRKIIGGGFILSPEGREIMSLFENYKDGLTVGELKRVLQNIPDEMPVCVRTLTDFFPANRITTGTYKLYPIGCNGVAQGRAACIKIE